MANAKRSKSRVFTIENGAGPANEPMYRGFAAAQTPEQSFGDVTSKKRPSPTQRGAFEKIDQIIGEDEDPTLSLSEYYQATRSEMLRLARKGCTVDVQIHHGLCTDPQDYNGGWVDAKILVLETGRITNWSTDEQGALEPGDDENILEETEFTGQELYEILPMTYSTKAANEVAQEIVKMLLCDTVSCGDCGTTSDGCQKAFAISAPAGSSPGVLPEVVYTTDGFTTIGETPIDTLAIGEDPDDAACVGDYLVVVSEDSISLHYADRDLILAGTETWYEVTTGFNASGGPRAITSVSPRDTWIGGAGGYIYKSTDPTAGVSVQDAASATTQDINDADAWNSDIVAMVTASNGFLITTNGKDWSLKTGPAVGVDLNAVAWRTDKEVWVGDAGGNLWYSLDRGDNWTQKAFVGDGAGSVEDIVWASNSVGFIAHQNSSTNGVIHRTTNGGNTWRLAPDNTGTVPTNDKINSLAVCNREVNILYAGGLADDAADGIIIKGSN